MKPFSFIRSIDIASTFFRQSINEYGANSLLWSSDKTGGRTTQTTGDSRKRKSYKRSTSRSWLAVRLSNSRKKREIVSPRAS